MKNYTVKISILLLLFSVVATLFWAYASGSHSLDVKRNGVPVELKVWVPYYWKQRVKTYAYIELDYKKDLPSSAFYKFSTKNFSEKKYAEFLKSEAEFKKFSDAKKKESYYKSFFLNIPTYLIFAKGEDGKWVAASYSFEKPQNGAFLETSSAKLVFEGKNPKFVLRAELSPTLYFSDDDSAALEELCNEFNSHDRDKEVKKNSYEAKIKVLDGDYCTETITVNGKTIEELLAERRAKGADNAKKSLAKKAESAKVDSE